MKNLGLLIFIVLGLTACRAQQVSTVTSAEHALLMNMRNVGLDPEKCAFGASIISSAGQSFARDQARAQADGNYTFPEECISVDNGTTTTRGQIEGSKSKLLGVTRLKDKEHILVLKCFEKIRCQ